MKSIALCLLLVLPVLLFFPLSAAQPQEPRPGEDAAAAVRAVAEGLAQDRPVVLWEALPAARQESVAALLARCAAKLDAQSWREGFEAIERMGLVLSNKQPLVRGSAIAISLLAMSSEDRSAAPWFRLGPLLVELGRSPLGDPLQLAKLDIDGFLRREGRAVSSKLADLSAATRGSLESSIALRDEFTSTTATATRIEGDRVLLRLESTAGARDAWFVKSGGKWLPEAYLQGWEARMARVEASCGQFAKDGKAARWLKTLGGARGAFGQLAEASTQFEFDSGMSGIAEAIGPELAQLVLDSMLGSSGVGRVRLNVGSIIYSPAKPEAEEPAPKNPPASEP